MTLIGPFAFSLEASQPIMGEAWGRAKLFTSWQGNERERGRNWGSTFLF